MDTAEIVTGQPKQLQHFVWGLAAGWTIVVAALILISVLQEREQALETARTQARSNYQRDVVYRHWVANHGTIYIPVVGGIEPNPYLAGIPERDIVTPSGKKLTMVNPAFMTRLVFDLAAREFGLRGRITSLRPVRAENSPDPWETGALRRFEAGENEFSSIEMIDGVEYLRLISPLKTEKKCLQCHGNQGYKLGEVRGGISVAVPMQPLRALAGKKIIISSLSFSFLWLAGLTGIFAGAARLRQVIRQRDKASEEIIALNNGLLVKTTELEEVNRDLDAFSAAVSHDLRSPVTAISGFSQLLQNVPGDRHAASCGEYGRIIYKQAMRMERLIEALLNFSRLSRKALRLEKVNLSELAADIVLDLRQREPLRPVDFRISAELWANGDPNLLHVAVQNLLGNAWKYTAKRECAVIEFGVTDREGERAFFFRDNGIGFDMQQAGKIFEPFQRLADVEDFKGSGVGLATVKRIIDRHGGRIWAEGEVGAGSTFYITLPESGENVCGRNKTLANIPGHGSPVIRN
jgi:signal transduction histidine kinase